MDKKRYIQLRRQDGESAAVYLELRDHPHEPTFGLVKRSVSIHQLIPGYTGPGISIEFDASDRPIGVEIIYPLDEK